MQQQLSSLHLVMEQSNSESDKQFELLLQQKQSLEQEKIRFVEAKSCLVVACGKK